MGFWPYLMSTLDHLEGQQWGLSLPLFAASGLLPRSMYPFAGRVLGARGYCSSASASCSRLASPKRRVGQITKEQAHSSRKEVAQKQRVTGYNCCTCERS